MANISVIIPVYNAGESIIPCLQSLLSQKTGQPLTGIEILLIDDCSTDDSWKDAVSTLLSGYEGTVSVRIDNTDVNGGPGAARNRGLQLAQGDYIAFVDADDLVEEDYCLCLCKAAVNNDADIVWCDALEESPTGSRLLRQIRFEDGALSRKARGRILRHYVTYLWTGLFRKQFLTTNGIVFPPFRSAEDSCFTACCWLCAPRAAAVRRPLYHYRIQPQSLSRKRNRNRWRWRLSSFSYLKEYAKDKGLWSTYRCSLSWLIFKKGWLLALRDCLIN